MNIDKKHRLTNGAEIIQSGDFVRFRDDDGVFGEWGSADHLAGSRLDSFADWYGMAVQFARVPTATAEQPGNLADTIERWQQESAPVPEGSQWITDPTEKIQRGDLYRVREDSHSDYCKWQSADHYAGTEVGFFAAWPPRDIQFCRPARPAPEPQWEMVSDRDYILRPGVDQVRCRTYLNESGHWGPWIAWHTIEAVQTISGFLNGPGGTAAAQEWQFRRRVTDARPAVEPAPEAEWEPLPLQDDTILQPGRDEARFRAGCGEWSAWVPLSGPPVAVTRFIGERPSHFVYEFRRQTESQPAPKQPPAPTPDRGSKYHRTITQTLPGDTHGLSVTGDVYDLLKAFGVTCPALQHAVKKLLCAGLRGAKSAEQDIQEAILSCRRAIELLEFEL